ncbi:MAG: 50S ribosomal protein L1, partial [Planctomycetaceae bacterium]
MTKTNKRQKENKALVEGKKEYSLQEAVSIIKKGPKTNFDQTVEV